MVRPAKASQMMAHRIRLAPRGAARDAGAAAEAGVDIANSFVRGIESGVTRP
ncbi:hypothetical protein Pen01_68640 [Phytomonospora endophytica]|nr:hypothetical protein Pen01_68640 [Phytomonospora endophytica]